MAIRGESKRNPVMLSTFATLSVNSAKHLEAHADRPFAAAQGVWITHIVSGEVPGHRVTRERRRQRCGTCVLGESAGGLESEPGAAYA